MFLKKEQLNIQQFLAKAQEQCELVIDAKVELGKLISDTPPAKNQYARSSKEQANKKTVYTDLNLTHKQAANYQLIANNPEAVEKAVVIANHRPRDYAV